MILQTMRTALLSIERVYLDGGHDRLSARKRMARTLGIGPGTIENLFRDRVKTISADLAAKIRRRWIDTIEAEIARLENEREMARKINLELAQDEIAKVESLLAQARVLVGSAKKGRR